MTPRKRLPCSSGTATKGAPPRPTRHSGGTWPLRAGSLIRTGLRSRRARANAGTSSSATIRGRAPRPAGSRETSVMRRSVIRSSDCPRTMKKAQRSARHRARASPATARRAPARCGPEVTAAMRRSNRRKAVAFGRRSRSRAVAGETATPGSGRLARTIRRAWLTRSGPGRLARAQADTFRYIGRRDDAPSPPDPETSPVSPTLAYKYRATEELQVGTPTWGGLRARPEK
jgi:hypothetical protein